MVCLSHYHSNHSRLAHTFWKCECHTILFFFFTFGLLPSEVPQPITCLRLTPSSWASSFLTQIYKLIVIFHKIHKTPFFAFPPSFLPATLNLSVLLPRYSLSYYWTCFVSNNLSLATLATHPKASDTHCSSDAHTSDPVHPGLSQREHISATPSSASVFFWYTFIHEVQQVVQ